MSTATVLPEQSKPTTERGYHSYKAWALLLDAAQALVDIELDTINQGGVSISWFISNLNTNTFTAGIGAGATTTLKFTLQYSNDRVNWTTAAKWKDDAGTEDATGAEATVTQNTNKYVILNFASYPEAAGQRFYRLRIRSGTALLSYASVHATIK